ncbi:hypothetical protein [Emticicia sp. 21SJ11W-3]|uniref:hypothetical protein n=1 Tax=Emticicia sp. 21SJ11W-3 TaxID=2916755 RepID=UPI00209FAC88|nr:hypothetical protein [Emticicia sp. 21SJ11W-3]UTA66581.1 hypothetical protein MB380_13320 [Emticicia sp. 21SJ11W-3]
MKIAIQRDALRQTVEEALLKSNIHSEEIIDNQDLSSIAVLINTEVQPSQLSNFVKLIQEQELKCNTNTFPDVTYISVFI